MVVDTNDGKLLGEVTGIDGAHGVAIAQQGRPRVRHLRQRRHRAHVRPEDVQGARQHSSGRRRRRRHLRRRVEPRLHLQRRRALVHGHRPGSRASSSRTSRSAASPSTVPRPATARSTRTSPTPARSWRSTRRQLTVTRRWSTAPCKQPVSMAIDVAHHRLFSGCRSGVMAISDYQAGKVVATLPIGSGCRRRRLRPCHGRRLRLERRRDADGDPPGQPRRLSRRREPCRRRRGRATWGSTRRRTGIFLRGREVRAGASRSDGGAAGRGRR